MALKQFTTDFKVFSKEKSFRSDVDFVDFQNEFTKDDSYSFSDLFSFSKENKVDLATFEEDFYYSEISNVSKTGEISPVKLNLSLREEENKDYYKKIDKGDIIRVNNGDILLSKVRPNLKKFVFIDNNIKDYYFTSAFVHLVPKKLNKIFYYCFSSLFYNDIVAISRQGKGYPTLKEDDFLTLRLNKKNIDKLTEKETFINKKIEEIENEIETIKTNIKTQNTVINEVFAREFGFNLDKFEELKKNKNYFLDLSACSNNKDLRDSVAFHCQSGQFVVSELKKITSSKIKHFISEPIVLGASISPSDFDENGEYYYVSMATIKNSILEVDDTQLVSVSYSNNNINKRIENNDIIMTRSGVSIGKFAIVDDDTKGIFADFTMRIRLKNYNPYFAYYYFRSEYFQHLIYTNKKGLQNKNIFPSQIQEFPIIDITLTRQQEIVTKIKEEIDRQNIYIDNIQKARAKINEIINKSIR